jgi:hypothetical protein
MSVGPLCGVSGNARLAFDVTVMDEEDLLLRKPLARQGSTSSPMAMNWPGKGDAVHRAGDHVHDAAIIGALVTCGDSARGERGSSGCKAIFRQLSRLGMTALRKYSALRHIVSSLI